MSAIEHLLKLSRLYADHQHVELSTLSWRMFGDTKKLTAMAERNADIQVTRFEKAVRWLSDNWPANLPWPAEVPRPVRASSSPQGAQA